MTCNLCLLPLIMCIWNTKHQKQTVITQRHRMSAQTFCLYNHNNKSILCLLLVLNPADSCCVCMCVCVLGGYCSDFNQFELTVLSSGVRLYISHRVVLHNDPQWRTLSKEQGYKMGEGCSSLRRFILLFLPFTTSEGIRGAFDPKRINERSIPHELERVRY